MRLGRRETTEERAWEIVDESAFGTISMIDAEGKPYGVVLNIWREGSNLYFHSAGEGKKADALRNNPNVSVSFVGHYCVKPEILTTKYASAVATGTASEVTDSEEKIRQLRMLCEKYGVPKDHRLMKMNFAGCMPSTSIWKIEVTEITGKEYI